jgi:hypothetical protein
VGKNLLCLILPCTLFCLAASAPAEWREYRVSARYSGLQDWKVPKSEKSPAQKAQEKNQKEGFSTNLNVRIFTTQNYTELTELSPDWLEGKARARLHGWDEDQYFSVIERMGSLGTLETLNQYLPLGQRLLLSSSAKPAEVFTNLLEKGRNQADGLVQINDAKSHMIKAQNDEIHDYFFAGGEWIRIGIYNLKGDGSLVMKRLRPDGSLVSEQVWSNPVEIQGKEAPKPLWERWKVGSYVRDLRVPGQTASIKWEGPETNKKVKSAARKTSSGYNAAWLIPGGVLTSLGLVMVALNSFRRQKPLS